MTVTYTAEVATCTGLGCFWKLLFRWRGSIYKLLWPNLLAYVFVYYTLNLVYRFALDADQKIWFERIARYCDSYSELIPLSFVLGFYVNLVVKRWWEMFQAIPSTDTLAVYVSSSIHGQDERSRVMRRTIMRYVNLSYVIILSMVSTRVKKRFPTLDHFVEAGVLLANEKKIFDDLNARSKHAKYWMPLVWAGSIVARARKEGRIRDDFAVKTLIDELCAFRSRCGTLNGYDWVSIPLVYTQVVTLAVYSFFAASLMGRQQIENTEGKNLDLYVPFFAFLQFFFYMGWLKVAESLVNPFGEDDDDFEMNWLIDRNLQVSYLIVDEMHAEHPELLKDQYWDEVLPNELPWTRASEQFRTSPHMGSTAHLELSAGAQEIMTMDRLSEEDEEECSSEEELTGVRISKPRPIRRTDTELSENTPSNPNSAPSVAVRVSRKPSVISAIQRVFQKDSVNLGSQMSLQSSAGRPRKPAYGRSVSRYSNANSRPQTPNLPTEDIFKMSDLSLSANFRSIDDDTKDTDSFRNSRPPMKKQDRNISKDPSSEEDEEPLIPESPGPLQSATRIKPASLNLHLHPSPRLLRKEKNSPRQSPRISPMPSPTVKTAPADGVDFSALFASDPNLRKDKPKVSLLKPDGTFDKADHKKEKFKIEKISGDSTESRREGTKRAPIAHVESDLSGESESLEAKAKKVDTKEKPKREKDEPDAAQLEPIAEQVDESA